MKPLRILSVRPAWVDARRRAIIRDAEAVLADEAGRLSFDPVPHVYTDRKTGAVPCCVSDVVGSFASFDAPAKAREVSLRDASRPGAKYYGMSPEAVLAAWKEKNEAASGKGTLLHSFAEACVCVAVGRPEDADPQWYGQITRDGKTIAALTPDQAGFIAALGSIPDTQVPVVKECRLYNDALGYAGTMDLLLCDIESDGFLLDDWKTNETLDKGHFARMKAPFGDLWDISLNHYVIQQSLYQIRLEALGFRVLGRTLLHVAPGGRFSPVRIGERIAALIRVLSERKRAGLRADGGPA